MIEINKEKDRKRKQNETNSRIVGNKYIIEQEKVNKMKKCP